MDIAYYPGCSLHALAHEYDRSTQLVCQHLGIKLHEIPDWNCCGATAAHSLDHHLNLCLSGRNLSLVDEMNLKQVMTPCAGCFNRLKGAVFELQNTDAREEVEETTGRSLVGAKDTIVYHLLQLFSEMVGLDKIEPQVVKPLQGVRVAAYYGCLITRPKAVVNYDDPECPVSMDNLLRAVGAEPVAWSHKAECCGGGFALSQTEIVVDLGGQVLEAARQADAQAIVVACPMCQANLDTRQKAIEADRGQKYELPILYITQMLGLALGYSAKQLEINRLLTSADDFLRAVKA